MDNIVEELTLGTELDPENREETISEISMVGDKSSDEREREDVDSLIKGNDDETIQEVEDNLEANSDNENINLVNKKLINNFEKTEELEIQIEEESKTDLENKEEYNYEDIINRLDNIKESFDESIKYDKYKDKLFDNLHKELIQYKNGLLDKIIETMAMDIIQMIDTTKKTINLYNTKEFSEENYKRLLGLFEGVAEDLQDIIYRQSIQPYSVAGDQVDVKQQKIISIEETTDIALDNKIVARLAEGYEKDGKVLRPERISIYKYKEDKGEN